MQCLSMHNLYFVLSLIVGNGAASLTGGNHNKISEQRRKRIQELETQIQGNNNQHLQCNV